MPAPALSSVPATQPKAKPYKADTAPKGARLKVPPLKTAVWQPDVPVHQPI
jgi:hypothetical protein